MYNMKKYKLSDSQRDFIRHKRRESCISAEIFSEKYLRKSKAWLGQIERGKLLTIKETDLITILSVFYDISKDTVINSGMVNNFEKCNFTELDKSQYTEIKNVKQIKNENEVLLQKIHDLQEENLMLKKLLMRKWT